MSDLAEFLLARIAEDEAVAQAAEVVISRPLIDYRLDLAEARHIARWDPARVLAECEAKRRIVEMATDEALQRDAREWAEASASLNTLEDVVALLALPYADHEQYREEWRV